MEQIGLEAVFRDAEFQQGLARYTAGVARMQDATTRAAMSMGNSMTAFSHTFSTAVGTVVGIISAQLIPQLQRAAAMPIDSLRAWGGQLDTLRDEFGMSGAEASQWAVSMSTYMGSVDEGASGLSAFVRNLNNMADGLKTAGSQYSTTMQDISAAHADAMARIAEDWKQSQADAADSIATVWQDLASRRADIEENLADSIANVNENLADRMLSIREDLQDRLDDIARERADVERDLTKSLSRLEEDYRDRMRNARSAKERRQVRKDMAERKRDLIEQAAERRAELDRQEAEARKNAEKQMALAEKLAAKQIAAAEKAAQKQIEAAEKAAQKQTEAIEKALAKQMLAMQRATAEQEKQYAKQQKAAAQAMGKAGTSDPIAKALKQLGVNAFTASGQVRPFAELMPEIMDAFKKLPPGINASAIAMQLFGRGGSKFLDFLRQGREGLIKAREEAKAWGLILSNEDTDAIEEFGYELNRMHLQFQGLGITIGREFMPYISELIAYIRTDILPAFMVMVKENMPALREALRQFSSWVKTDGLPALQQFADWMKENWPKITAAIAAAWKVIKPILEALAGWLSSDGIDALGVFFDKVGEFEPLVKEWSAWMGDMFDISKSTTKKINDDADTKFTKLSDIVRDAMDTIKRFFTERMEFIRDFQKTTTALMEGNWRYFFDNLTKLFSDVWGITLPGIISRSLTDMGRLIGEKLIEPINSAIGQINRLIEQYKLFGGLKLPTIQSPTSAPQTPGTTLNTTNTTSGLPLYDLGGWVRRTGPALVHAGEYVLNPMQARVMAPVLASANNSRTTYNFSHTWNGNTGSMDRREIERIVETATYRSIRQVVGSG